MQLRLEAFDSETFKPYGSTVSLPPSGDGTDLLTHLEPGGPGTSSCAKLDTHPAKTVPFKAAKLESHPLSEQLFLPLGPARYVIGAALPGADGAPDPATFRGFLVEGTTGICYRRGVWHLPITILDRPTTFLMMMAAVGDPAVDTAWAELARPVEVVPA